MNPDQPHSQWTSFLPGHQNYNFSLILCLPSALSSPLSLYYRSGGQNPRLRSNIPPSLPPPALNLSEVECLKLFACVPTRLISGPTHRADTFPSQETPGLIQQSPAPVNINWLLSDFTRWTDLTVDDRNKNGWRRTKNWLKNTKR